jgi:hypothetical protein
MRRIYSNAAEVIVWLGPEETEIPEHRTTDPTQTPVTEEKVEISRLFSFIRQHSNTCALINSPIEGCELKIDQGLGRALRLLKQSPYWNRVWIIQEVVIVREARFMCVAQLMPWPCFTRFLQLVTQGHFRISRKGDSAQTKVSDHRQTFTVLRLAMWPQTRVDLAQALDWSASSLATDGRDKVYALLGLVNMGAGQQTVADYTQSPCTVFCISIRAIIKDWTIDLDDPFLDKRVTDYYRAQFQTAVGVIPQACVETARRRVLSSPKFSASTGSKTTVLVTEACDGMKCGSKSAMYSTARWHKFPVNLGSVSPEKSERFPPVVCPKPILRHSAKKWIEL